MTKKISLCFSVYLCSNNKKRHSWMTMFLYIYIYLSKQSQYSSKRTKKECVGVCMYSWDRGGKEKKKSQVQSA